MNKVILSLAAFSLLFASCGGSSNDQSNSQAEVAENTAHHHDESEAIVLNHGEKWNVDTNMLALIRTMESDVISFAELEQKDYESLVKSLRSNIDLLTSNCTMKGQAHDELHKWLLPYIDMVEELNEAKNDSEASKQFENIRVSFSTFNQYFK